MQKFEKNKIRVKNSIGTLRKWVITMRYRCIYQTVEKLGLWAEELEDDIDFVDYWHNLMLSKTKSRIDNFDDRINAFWISRF